MERYVVAAVACATVGVLAQGAGQQALVGTWLMRTTETEIRAEFRANGTYSLSIRTAENRESQTGKYRAASGTLHLQPADVSEGETLRYRLVNANTLDVVDEDGDGYRLVRAGAGATTPAPRTDLAPAVPMPNYRGSTAPQPTPRQPAPQKAAWMSTVAFQRVTEPRERAFTVLIPRGWQTQGGIFRVNPIQHGPTNAIAAKCDFTIRSDARGTMMIRSLPEMIYCDARWMPAGQMGLIRPGSNYKGMIVSPLMSALQFLQQVAFRHAHPQAQGVRLVEQRQLPKLAAAYQQRARAVVPIQLSYDAGLITVAYHEGGVQYRERLFTMIENWGQVGAGMWVNKETALLRAPANQFAAVERVFSVVRKSVRVNPQWLIGELRAQVKRGQIMIKTEQEVQRIGREIAEHRARTNAEINNDVFLTLTDQEEYVNPYTNQVETGSNQWQRRWVNESGEVIYTDREDYDPNTDVNLNRSGWKRSPVRPRFPQ